MAARCATEPFRTTCAVHIEDCEGWGCLLSGKTLAAQARGVQGSTPGNCRLFQFPLLSPTCSNLSVYVSTLLAFLYFQQSMGSTQVTNRMTVGDAVKAGGANYSVPCDNCIHGAGRVMSEANK